MPMTKDQKTIAKAKLAMVRELLTRANLFVSEDDSLRAFQAAEEAYMAAWEAKDYLDRLNSATFEASLSGK